MARNYLTDEQLEELLYASDEENDFHESSGSESDANENIGSEVELSDDSEDDDKSAGIINGNNN